jgi:hypothetical protein
MDEELDPSVMCFTEHHIAELSPGFINFENYVLMIGGVTTLNLIF